MSGIREYCCILCKKRTKPDERRTVTLKDIQVLIRKLAVTSTDKDVLCNKCRHKCRKLYTDLENKKPASGQLTDSSDPTYSPSPKRSKHVNISSPPSVTLQIPSTSKSHAYCFLCKRPGPKLVTVSSKARLRAYIKTKVLVVAGARCCPGHLHEGFLKDEAIENLTKTNDCSYLNRTTITDILKGLREMVVQQNRIDFDSTDMDDEDYQVLTGLSKSQFDDILSHIKTINSSKSRSVRTCVGLLLVKLRCALSNKMLAVLFNMTKYQVRRAIKSARNALMKDFVPQNLGFQHVTREEVKNSHTRQLAKELFSSDSVDPAILVLDGTYIFIQKSANFSFSRRSYSVHKHRPLLKPMVVVTTTGYIVSILGPYLADFKNNDAGILKHMAITNAEEIKDWTEEGDIFVVDRGFRDAYDILNDMGIKMEMPSFLQRGLKQHPTQESNTSRLVTKVRWIVEAVNGRLKNWKFLDKTLPNTQIPFIGDYVRIIAAICNKYKPPLCSDSPQDMEIAAKMLYLSKQENHLKTLVLEQGLDKRSFKWSKIDAKDVALDFPTLTEEEVRQLTLGVYQIKLARSYAHEHLDDDGNYELLINDEIPEILCSKIQSRHTSSKQYKCWIGYSNGVIESWYCQCKSGARVVGMCAHLTSIIWYLSFGRHELQQLKGVRNWSECVKDASALPEDVIDASDSEEEHITEE